MLGSMKLNVRWISIAAILLSLSGCSDKGDGRESAGDKREWSILQGIEVESRSSVPSAPEFRVVEGYELLSVPSIGGSARIWIMLWPKSPPYYKQLPDGNFMIPNSLLNDLVRGQRISSTVEQALRSHVAN
jgi:hypothetical protein